LDDIAYDRRQMEESAEYEALCRHCGTCCGSKGLDPCANLIRKNDGTFACRNYETRIGVQHTVTGKTFTCIPIRDVIKFGIPFEGCGYNSHSL
jgi:uncharacterized cysteine cluster protein YcgN (CxxCxxCC family)